jgi:hypothetical protein
MDRPIVSPPKSSWFVKFIECLIVLWLVLTAIFYNLIAPKGWKVAPVVFSIAALLGIGLCHFLFGELAQRRAKGGF